MKLEEINYNIKRIIHCIQELQRMQSKHWTTDRSELITVLSQQISNYQQQRNKLLKGE